VNTHCAWPTSSTASSNATNPADRFAPHEGRSSRCSTRQVTALQIEMTSGALPDTRIEKLAPVEVGWLTRCGCAASPELSPSQALEDGRFEHTRQQAPGAQAGLRQHPLHQVRGGRAHPSSWARRRQGAELLPIRPSSAFPAPLWGSLDPARSSGAEVQSGAWLRCGPILLCRITHTAHPMYRRGVESLNHHLFHFWRRGNTRKTVLRKGVDAMIEGYDAEPSAS